jgi:N-methylhydantoinase A
MNGYVGPHAARYFDNLAAGLVELGVECPLYTVTSNGGLVDARRARKVPVRTALSGPAAGVSGIGRLLADHGFGDMVTFDVGGTSTDVAIVTAGQPRLVRSRAVAGHPVLAPMVDIEVIGAGGGSLARIDAGGALVVGPDSAGADPGPVAYGQGGTIPTVTDAALVLRRLNPEIRLGGSLAVDSAAAEAAIEAQLAMALGLSVDEAAEGILAIATANMARTIRSVAIGRGIEPEGLTLVAYGGAGPLLAVDVAAALHLKRVVVPAAPGTLCARAILVSDIARDYSRTRITPLTEAGWPDLCAAFDEMESAGHRWLASEGSAPPARRFDRMIEARYQGQNFEIACHFAANEGLETAVQRFHAAHAREQGFSLPDRTVEAVTLRLKASTPPPGQGKAEGVTGNLTTVRSDPVGTRAVLFSGARHDSAIYDRERLGSGDEIIGPAVFEEATATTVLPPGWCARVLSDETLVIERVREPTP